MQKVINFYQRFITRCFSVWYLHALLPCGAMAIIDRREM